MSDKEHRTRILELESLMEGLTNIEKALMLAGALRKAHGGEWVINMKVDGGFTIKPKNAA
jgi:secreted protein with Ig-like and vWFA domain